MAILPHPRVLSGYCTQSKATKVKVLQTGKCRLAGCSKCSSSTIIIGLQDSNPKKNPKVLHRHSIKNSSALSAVRARADKTKLLPAHLAQPSAPDFHEVQPGPGVGIVGQAL